MNEQELMNLFLSQLKHCNFDTKVQLSDPISHDDGMGNNTRVFATVTGAGFKPYKIWYDYHRPVFKPRTLPIELIYEDEEADISTLFEQLAHKYGMRVSLLKTFPLKGKIKSYLTKDSPLGHYHIKIDNYECLFEQQVEFAPDKLDVRYIFNEIVTIKNGDVVYRHERQEKEVEHYIPLWMLMKCRLEDSSKENPKPITDVGQKAIENETYVHHLEEQHL